MTFEVTVAAPLPDNTQVVNVADATGDGGLTASDSVSQIVSSSPVLDVVKIADPPTPGPLTASQLVTYTVTVRNLGDRAATGVTVTDPTPSGTRYVAGSTTLDGAPVADVGGADPNPLAAGVDVGDLLPGEPARTVRFQVRVDDPIADAATIENLASVAASEGVTAVSAPVRHTVDVTPGVALSPNRTGDAHSPGQAVYAHIVENTGDLTDTYQLEASSSNGWRVAVYRDADGDGAWDPTTESETLASTGPLPPGTRLALLAVVHVPADVSPGTLDTATLGAISVTDPAVRATVVDRTRVVGPALELVKTSDPSGDQVNAGQTITYALTVRNRGTVPAASAHLTDDTPAGTSYVAGSTVVDGEPLPDEGGDGNPLSAANGGHALGTLQPADTVRVVFQVVVDADAELDTLITNQALATADDTPDATDVRVHTVTEGPVLHLTKTAEPAPRGPVTVGDVLRYTITVRNVGQQDATGVIITDATPLHTEYVAGSATRDGAAVESVDNPFGGGYLIGDLPAGGQPVVLGTAVTVADPVVDGDVIVNVADATSAEGATGRASVEHDVDVHPEVVVSTGTAENALPGGTATYTHTITNTGDVSDAYVLAAVSARGWVAVVRGDPDGDGVAQQLTRTGELRPGESLPVTVTVTVPVSATPGTVDELTLTATSMVDPTVQASAVDRTTVVAARLTLTKTANPQSLTPGSRATYQLVVRNAGEATASSVRLSDPTPAGTRYVTGSTRRDGSPIGDVTSGDGNPLGVPGGLLLGNLASGASTTVTFDVTTLADADREVVVNVATATSTDAPTVRSGTTQPVSVRHGLELGPPRVGTVVRSGQVTYAHVLTNTGDLADEVVLETLSSSGYPTAVHLDADADGVLDADDPEFTDPLQLAAGGSVALLAVVSIPDGAPGGLEDELTIRATSLGDPNVTVVVTDVTRVVAPVLDAVKDVDPPVAAALGQRLTYTIRVINSGDADSDAVVVTDRTPAGTVYVPGSVRVDGAALRDAGGADGNPLDDRVGGVDIGPVPAGGERVVSFEATVGADVVAGTELTNVALLNTDGAMFPSTTAAVTVVDAPSLLVAKGVSIPGVATVGSRITWTVQVTNASEATATDVVVTDALPAGLSYVPGSTVVDGAVRLDGDGDVVGGGLQIGPLPAGATRTIAFDTLVAAAAAGGFLENVATATDRGVGTAVESNAVLIGVEGGDGGVPFMGFGPGGFGPGGFGPGGFLAQTGSRVGRTLGLAASLALAGWVLLYVARREERLELPPPPRR